MVRAFLTGSVEMKNRPTVEQAHDERVEVKMPGFPATAHARTTGRRLSRCAGLAAFLGLALLLTACGGGASGSASDPAKDPPRKAEDAKGPTPNPATTTTQKVGTTTPGETTAANETGASEAAGSEQATTGYLVPTMSCPGCFGRIEAAASKDPGVLDIRLDQETPQRVIVEYDPSKTNPEKIAQAIRDGGDEVVPDE